jgi:hypothetical protein
VNGSYQGIALAMPCEALLQTGFSPWGAAANSNSGWADERVNWAASLTKGPSHGSIENVFRYSLKFFRVKDPNL